MNALIDTNVVLDVVLKNALFQDSSRVILDKAEQRQFTGYISASAITDIFYLSQKKIGKKIAKEVIKELLHIFYPATVTDSNIYEAFELDWDDFEDSVQYVVGESFDVNYIVTRNVQDYSSGSIPAVTPEQFIQAISDDNENE